MPRVETGHHKFHQEVKFKEYQDRYERFLKEREEKEGDRVVRYDWTKDPVEKRRRLGESTSGKRARTQKEAKRRYMDKEREEMNLILKIIGWICWRCGEPRGRGFVWVKSKLSMIPCCVNCGKAKRISTNAAAAKEMGCRNVRTFLNWDVERQQEGHFRVAEKSRDREKLFRELVRKELRWKLPAATSDHALAQRVRREEEYFRRRGVDALLKILGKVCTYCGMKGGKNAFELGFDSKLPECKECRKVGHIGNDRQVANNAGISLLKFQGLNEGYKVGARSKLVEDAKIRQAKGLRALDLGE